MTPTLGDTVDVRMTKWGDRPHWCFASVYLGDDEHGTWLGFPRGTRMTRPGAEYVSPTDQLGLVPPASWPGSSLRVLLNAISESSITTFLGARQPTHGIVTTNPYWPLWWVYTFVSRTLSPKTPTPA